MCRQRKPSKESGIYLDRNENKVKLHQNIWSRVKEVVTGIHAAVSAYSRKEDNLQVQATTFKFPPRETRRKEIRP